MSFLSLFYRIIEKAAGMAAFLCLAAMKLFHLAETEVKKARFYQWVLLDAPLFYEAIYGWLMTEQMQPFTADRGFCYDEIGTYSTTCGYESSSVSARYRENR